MTSNQPPDRPTPGRVALSLLLWALGAAAALAAVIYVVGAVVATQTIGRR